MNLTVDDLIQKIGFLYLENEALRKENNGLSKERDEFAEYVSKLASENKQLKEHLNGKREPDTGGEDNQVRVGAGLDE